MSGPDDLLTPPSSLRDRLALRIAAQSGAQPVAPTGSNWTEPAWDEVAPGISCQVLARDPDHGVLGMLVRLAPGTEYPAHTHTRVEEIHLLHGELISDEGRLCPGDYSRSEPGTSVRRVSSETLGACMLVASGERTTDRRLAERLAGEMRALARLNEASSRLWRIQNLEQGLQEMLNATVELLGADMGNVQLLADDVLTIAAQRGFHDDFLHFFREVSADDDSACGRALRSGGRIVIEDVETDAPYAPLREIARKAGYRAVQSTALVAHDGRPLGMISTHWREPHLPDEQDLRRLDLFVRQAADFIERCHAEERLREADRRKDEFIAVISHELRNPLAPLSNALQALVLNGGADPDGKLRGMMARQTKQLVRLVNDLLEASRMNRGLLDLCRVPVNVSQVLSNAVETIEPLSRDSEHDLSVELPPQPIWVMADAGRLEQTFANLLSNAVRYTPRGGRIWLCASCDEQNRVRVSVRDTGVGLSAETRKRLFEMFGRGAESKGLGIGLALARRLIELHDGAIEARSEGEGRGAEFVVYLPQIEPPAAQPQT